MPSLVWAAAVAAAAHLSGASPDSVRITVSPDCSVGSCWPYDATLAAHGQLAFVQALVHKDANIGAELAAALLDSASVLFDPVIPDRNDGDLVLCHTTVPRQPVVTMSLFQGDRERRVVDFRWCGVDDNPATPSARHKADVFAKLRQFEDAILALPAIASHVKN
ncbi:MAG: hypothetical protein ABI294_02915 [Casimicrobiaceae bacterium]